MNNTYTDLLKITQKMLTHAENQEWEKLSNYEKQREVIIEKITEKPLAANNSDSDILHEIIILNEKVLAITKENQELYSKALLDLKRSTKKTSLYQE